MIQWIRNWGSSNSVHPILCVCRTVVGYFDACSELSWQMCQKFSTTAGYHDVCGGSYWLRLMFLIFFLLNRSRYWAPTMHIMIKHHCTEQQAYAIMVTHHMHYDYPLLYHIHFAFYLCLKFIYVMNLSKSANTPSECYNGVIIFATQSFRISVDSKKKWLKREL